MLDFESNTESCRDSIQTPFSLYGTHCNFSVQCICSSFPPLHSSSLPLPVCADFFNPWSFSTNATPSPWCWPEGTWRPLMLVLGLSSVFTQTDTRTQCYVSGAVINQQFDLPGQTEKCPYKGSSIGKKLHTGGMQQDRGGAVCCVCSNRKMGCAHTHTHTKKLTFIMRIMSYVLVGNSPGRLQ